MALVARIEGSNANWSIRRLRLVVVMVDSVVEETHRRTSSATVSETVATAHTLARVPSPTIVGCVIKRAPRALSLVFFAKGPAIPVAKEARVGRAAKEVAKEKATVPSPDRAPTVGHPQTVNTAPTVGPLQSVNTAGADPEPSVPAFGVVGGNKNKERARMLPFGGSFLLTLDSLFSVVLLSYHPTSWVFLSSIHWKNSSRKIHFAPLSGFFYQNCQSRFTFLYFFFWALESFASLFWLAVAVSTSKLFLLLYVSHCLADM